MMSKGRRLQVSKVKGDTLLNHPRAALFLVQMDSILEEITCLYMEVEKMKFQLAQYYGATQVSPAKPSKKQQRTVKPRTSTRRKA